MKDRFRSILTGAFVPLLLVACASRASMADGCCGSEDEQTLEARYSQEEIVTISGRVRRVGSEPFTRLVVTDSLDIDWYLDEEGEQLLLDVEQELVTIHGTVFLQPIVLADGTRLGFRHELRGVRLASAAE